MITVLKCKNLKKPSLLQKGTDGQITETHANTNGSSNTKIIELFHDFLLRGLCNIREFAIEFQMRIGRDGSLVPLISVSLCGWDANDAFAADFHAL